MSSDVEIDAAYEKYWNAVATGDRSSAVEVALQVRDAGLPLPDVLDRLVATAQREVGARWAAGEWDVAQEHRATSISEEVVAAVSLGIMSPPNGRTALITCADGEWHALPSRILAAVLRYGGWQVTFLGASVPARQLTQLLHDVGPDLVAISCALPTRLRQARRMIEVARAARVPVIVGGLGFGADGRWGLALGATAWAPDARSALTSVDLPDFVDPAPPLPALDDTADQLHEHRAAIVATCMERLDPSSKDDDERARIEEDFGYIVEFLSAALFVDDAAVFTEFVSWLDAILAARSEPSDTLRADLDLAGSVIAEQLANSDRAVRFLAAGKDVIGASERPS